MTEWRKESTAELPNSGRPAAVPPGLYVHLPFCAGKCLYCHFLTFPYGSLVGPYLEAIRREAEAAMAANIGWDRPDTLYFGGGTPSLIPADQLGGLVRWLREFFQIPQGAEISLEANPEDVTATAAAAWAEAGINRVTLGVQTILDKTLALMRRKGGADQAARAVSCLRQAGLLNLGLDLIAGLPGEAVPDFRQSLEFCLALKPRHLSLYLLEIEPKTGLERKVRSGEWRLASDDDIAGYYLEACGRLEQSGLLQYEISNFAAVPDRSRHNLKYWELTPFLGLGCGAHGFDGRRRFWNESRLPDYLRKIQSDACARQGADDGATGLRESEFVFMGLRRTAGIRRSDFRRRFGREFPPAWVDRFEKYIVQGLMLDDNDTFRLTPRGMLLSNEIFQEILDDR